MGPRYHSETLRLLAVEPNFDAEATAQIAVAEAECDRQLPGAVREWYTLVGAEELLTLNDNACGVTYLADFLKDFVSGRRDIEFYGPRQVNTGYQAFVQLDGTEDPLVYVDGDERPVPFVDYVRSLAEYKTSSGI